MNVDLFALRAFVCLAAELNFARSADMLNVSPSRLTRVIQSLEREVGVQLLARSPHHTSLTQDGSEFLRSASRIVAEADWAAQRFTRHRSTGSATFIVGCQSGTLYDLLPQRVRAARAAYPSQYIHLVERDESAITQQVLDGTLDVGFLYVPAADEDLVSRVVARHSHWVAMAPDHPLAQHDTLSVKQMAGHVLILPDEARAPRLHRWYRSVLDKAGPRAFKFISVTQIHVALGLCAGGEGLCVVADHLRRMRTDDLRYVPFPEAPRSELSAIWRRDSPVRHISQFIAKW